MYNEQPTLGLIKDDDQNNTTSDVLFNTSTQSKITKHRGNLGQEKSELRSSVVRDLRLAQHACQEISFGFAKSIAVLVYTGDVELRTSAHQLQVVTSVICCCKHK